MRFPSRVNCILSGDIRPYRPLVKSFKTDEAKAAEEEKTKAIVQTGVQKRAKKYDTRAKAYARRAAVRLRMTGMALTIRIGPTYSSSESFFIVSCHYLSLLVRPIPLPPRWILIQSLERTVSRATRKVIDLGQYSGSSSLAIADSPT